MVNGCIDYCGYSFSFVNSSVRYLRMSIVLKSLRDTVLHRSELQIKAIAKVGERFDHNSWRCLGVVA